MEAFIASVHIILEQGRGAIFSFPYYTSHTLVMEGGDHYDTYHYYHWTPAPEWLGVQLFGPPEEDNDYFHNPENSPRKTKSIMSSFL